MAVYVRAELVLRVLSAWAEANRNSKAEVIFFCRNLFFTVTKHKPWRERFGEKFLGRGRVM